MDWPRIYQTPAGVVTLALTFAFGPSAMGQLPEGNIVPQEVSTIEQAAKETGLTDLQLSTRVLSPGRIVVECFTARLGGGSVQGTGLVEVTNPSRRHQMKVTLSGVEASALLRAMDIDFEGTIDGRIDARTELTWTGLSGGQIKSTLAGPLRLSIGSGSISGADVLDQAVKATGVDGLKTFTFSSGQAAGVFRSGRFDLESAVLGGETEEVRGRGTIHLPSSQVNVDLQIYVEPSIAAGSKDRLSPSEKKTYPAAQHLVRLPQSATATGSLQDPQFSFHKEN